MLCKPEFRVKGKDYEIPATGKDYTSGRQRFKWSSWSSCSEGQEYKHRTRINPKKGKMEGQSEICVSSKVGPGVHRGKNGKILPNKSRSKYQWSSWSSCSEGQATKQRTRINQKTGKKHGERKDCVWSKNGEIPPNKDPKKFQWSTWTSCNKGQRVRKRTRIHPKKGIREFGKVKCNENGEWSGWSSCSEGQARQSRSRTNPLTGRTHAENINCLRKYQWSSWSSCSEGQEYKHRTKINIKTGKMEGQGEICVSSKVGPGVHRGKNGKILPNKGLSKYKWSSWSSCSEGQEYKHRKRINPKKGKMEGQSEICVSSKVGPVVHRIKNGKIMPNNGFEYKWSSWTSCSEGQEYKHRRRINPKKGKMEGQSEICVSSKVGPGWHQGKGAEILPIGRDI